MRKIFISIFITLQFLALLSCGGRRGEVTLTVLATSDMHGMIFPNEFMDTCKSAMRKGCVAKVSAFIREERRKNPGGVVYLDCGDILAGGMEVYWDRTSNFETSGLAASVQNLLETDASTLGNHDFYVGMLEMDKHLSRVKHPVICANLFTSSDTIPALPPYTMIERKGVRIAVVGMTLPIIGSLMPPDAIDGYLFKSITESAEAAVRLVKEREEADLIVGLFHSGISQRAVKEGLWENETLEAALKVPGFDIIFYGHDHDNMPDCRQVTSADGKTLSLVAPSPYARGVAKVSVSLDFKNKRVVSKTITPEICTVTDLEPDQEFLSHYTQELAAVASYADSVVGRLNVPLNYRESFWKQSTYMDYMHELLRRVTGADITLASPSLSYRQQFPAGNVTMTDLFRMYPFENSVVMLSLTGEQVIRILENSLEGWIDQVDNNGTQLLKSGNPTFLISAGGLDYTVDVTKPLGSRVRVESMASGRKFEPQKSYIVATNSHLALGVDSKVLETVGINNVKDFASHFYSSTSADIRFYIITQFALSSSGVAPQRYGEWRMVPENLVNRLLAGDTLRINTKFGL